MEDGGRTLIRDSDTLCIVRVVASLVLVFASILLVEVFSVSYGVGVGALLQGNLTHTNVSGSLVSTALDVSALRTSILEMYIVSGIAVGMFLLAFILYSMKDTARAGADGSRYLMLHLVLSLVFAGFFAMEFYTYSIKISPIYLGAIGAAMLVCIGSDAYAEYALRPAPSRQARVKKEINIDPSTPFSNIVAIRDEIFANLSGRVAIVDKHFNSEALENLHRLTGGIVSGITGFDVITSKEMLDSAFYKDYNDLKNEMKNRGVDLSVMLMDDTDATAQHERFILDGSMAYKIPPMNIIQRKSEHVTKIKTSDARRRFDEIRKNAITLENYAVKQARKPDQQ